jgi:hypothetical protein
MSMRAIERPTEPGHWDRSQSSDLLNGTLGIVACFALVCLFVMAMLP